MHTKTKLNLVSESNFAFLGPSYKTIEIVYYIRRYARRWPSVWQFLELQVKNSISK